MARLKLERVKDLDVAKARLAAIKSISPTLDLGGGITVVNYQAIIEELTNKLAEYNTTLSKVDDLYNSSIDILNKLRDISERMLAGVAAKYGKKSSEYEMAGGTRKTEKKKPTKKAATKPV